MKEVDILIPFHMEPDVYLYKAIASAKESIGVVGNILLIDNRFQKTEFSLKGLGSDIKIIENYQSGYASSINCGVRNSTAPYVAMLNSDDLQDRYRIQHQVEGMHNHETPVSICKLKKFSKFRPVFELSGNQPSSRFHKSLLMLGPYGANASIIMTNDFARAHPFKINISMADWEFAFTSYPERIFYSSCESYFYRIHKKQSSRERNLNYSWLAQEWRSFFTAMGGKDISQELIEVIAMPNKLTKLTLSDYQNLREIYEILLDSVDPEPLEFYEQYRNLLKRRLTIATLRSRSFKGLMYFKDIFPKDQILFDALEFCSKASLNYDLARKL